MDTVTTLDPSQRQVLVGIGNRYVVFGPSASLPQSIRFNPHEDAALLPRVDYDSERSGERIEQTLRVAGMTRSAPGNVTPEGDVELLDDDGRRIFIEIKAREHDPRTRDVEQAGQRLREAARSGRTLEVWYFNTERLKLVVIHLDRMQLRIDELVPLDVWEKTEDGVYGRAKVVGEVEDWADRIGRLYDQVQDWLTDTPEFRCERSRSVIMSEDLMQVFAVPDREVPVLDVLEADQVVASLVPRGLWFVGAWGRIDIITRSRTHALLAQGDPEKLEWRLVVPQSPQRTALFDRSALLDLLRET